MADPGDPFPPQDRVTKVSCFGSAGGKFCFIVPPRYGSRAGAHLDGNKWRIRVERDFCFVSFLNSPGGGLWVGGMLTGYWGKSEEGEAASLVCGHVTNYSTLIPHILV